MVEKEEDAIVTEASTNGDVPRKGDNVPEGEQVTESSTNRTVQKEDAGSKDVQVTNASANDGVLAEEDNDPKTLEHAQENEKKEPTELKSMEQENALTDDDTEEKGVENTQKEIGADEANNKVNNVGTEKKEPKKHGRGGKKTKESKEKEDAKDTKKGSEVQVRKKRKVPSTPAPATTDRPTRERKTVERFAISSEKDLHKELLIEKGHGTRLKDIPNVAFHLSKRNAGDILKVLHVIIFGRRGKNPHIKSNISQFSGFVWGNNEGKQKIKVREKLDKCVKARLLEFCELFDLPILKTTDRKEELVAKLLDFLEAPHATRDVLLSEQGQLSKKRKRVVKSVSGTSPSSSAKGATKRQKKLRDTPKSHGRKSAVKEVTDSDGDNEEEEEEIEKEKPVEEVDGLEVNDSDVSDAEAETKSNKEDFKKEKVPKKSSKEVSSQKVIPQKVVHSDASDEESLEGSAEEDVKKRKPSKKSSEKISSRKTPPKKSMSSKKAAIPSKPVKSPAKSSLKRVQTEERPKSSAKVFSRKKSDDKQKSDDKRKLSTPDKLLSKNKEGKKVAKRKDESRKKGKDGPTSEELRKAICDILKEVDFNTATFTDILKQLAANFKTDLIPRKAEIKAAIQDELTKLADEADDDDDEEDGDGDDGEGVNDKQKEGKHDA